MSLISRCRYVTMKEVGAPVLMRADGLRHKKTPKPRHPAFGPGLKSTRQLKRIMSRHYYLARFAPGAKPVAWVTSGAPVELLRTFGFYTVYPENHGALVGARRMGADLCAVAEEHGYSQDLCSYARIDLGHLFGGKTPAGRLPRPDLLFCSNNICQTIVYWFRVLAHHHRIPLVLFDTPYNSREYGPAEIAYLVSQLEDMIPVLENASGCRFRYSRFQEIITLAKETSLLWGRILATLKHRPAPMSIFEAFGHLAPVVSLRGLPVARDYYRLLLAELEERLRQGIGALQEERRRLMWDNIAIWYRIGAQARLFAERGMNFVTATYTNAWAETTPYMDTSRPFESLARAYGLVILNNHLEYRLNLMQRLIREFQVEGLVLHSARSCKPYSVGQYDLKSLLRQRLKIPAVVIDGDITDPRAYSEEQTRTRLEAFFEVLG